MGWFPVAARLSDATSCQATLLNDADVAGIAEMQFGHGKGENGTVILLTLGTGLGSALFVEQHVAAQHGSSAISGSKVGIWLRSGMRQNVHASK